MASKEEKFMSGLGLAMVLILEKMMPNNQEADIAIDMILQNAPTDIWFKDKE